MREELDQNEDVLFDRQIERVRTSMGKPVNVQRRYVSVAGVCFWLFLPLIALHLWLLRLLGVVSLPF